MKKAMLALVPALLAIGTTAKAADAPVWKVSEVTGDVKVMDGGHSRAAVKGSLLASGAVVVAGANARAVLVHDKDFVIVSPNSRIRIALPEQQKGIFQVISEFGTSLFRIEHKATPHFGVQTPYLAAVVKGTVFSVTVTSTGASVQVTQGAVDVGTIDGGAHELVRPGMIASVGIADRFSLKIDGDVSHTIRSPGAPAASVLKTSPTASSESNGKGRKPESGTVVGAPIAAPPVSLADTTGGLVQGNNAVALASIHASKGEIAHHDNNGSGAGNGGGAADHSGSGNGGSDNGGTGSSNGGGSGNGSGGGNGGAGNGNPGGSNGNGAGGGSNGGSGNGNPGGSNGSGAGGGNGGSGNANGGGSNGGGPGSGPGGNSDDGSNDAVVRPEPTKGKGLAGGVAGAINGGVVPPAKPVKND